MKKSRSILHFFLLHFFVRVLHFFLLQFFVWLGLYSVCVALLHKGERVTPARGDWNGFVGFFAA